MYASWAFVLGCVHQESTYAGMDELRNNYLYTMPAVVKTIPRLSAGALSLSDRRPAEQSSSSARRPEEPTVGSMLEELRKLRKELAGWD